MKANLVANWLAVSLNILRSFLLLLLLIGPFFFFLLTIRFIQLRCCDGNVVHFILEYGFSCVAFSSGKCHKVVEMENNFNSLLNRIGMER